MPQREFFASAKCKMKCTLFEKWGRMPAVARPPRDPESPKGLSGRADAAPPRGPPAEKQNPAGG